MVELLSFFSIRWSQFKHGQVFDIAGQDRRRRSILGSSVGDTAVSCKKDNDVFLFMFMSGCQTVLVEVLRRKRLLNVKKLSSRSDGPPSSLTWMYKCDGYDITRGRPSPVWNVLLFSPPSRELDQTRVFSYCFCFYHEDFSAWFKKRKKITTQSSCIHNTTPGKRNSSLISVTPKNLRFEAILVPNHM